MRELETSRAGRRVLSAAAIVLLGLAVVGSFTRGRVSRAQTAVGFQQTWDVFAPDPIHRDVRFDAVIGYADGGESTWHVQRAGAVFPYPSQRWELWQTRLVDDSFSVWWERAARWIAAHHAQPSRSPVRVVLRRLWSDLPPPGMDPSLRRWNQFDFYTLDLR